VDGGEETLIDLKTGNQNTITTIEGTASGKKLVLKIKAKVSFSDEYYYMDNLSVKYAETSINDKADAMLPTQTQLLQNYPNPFNSETTFFYQLAEHSRARLTICNILGKEVNRLVDRDQSAGHYSVIWNGRDFNGNKVSSGIYFYMLETNKAKFTKSLIVLQ
jgi:flagellar hook assembly protein FlgD